MSVDLRLGDCAEVMRTLPDSSIDLILTSPPYDNLRKYESGSAFDFEGTADQCKRLLKPGGVLVWVVGDQTVNGSESGTSFRQALHFKGIGLRLHDTMMFGKSDGFPHKSQYRYEQKFEFMFVMTKDFPKTFNRLMEQCKCVGQVKTIRVDQHRGHNERRQYKIGETKGRSNIWFYSTGSKRNHGHPAVFPLQLAIDHILSWTNPGDLVLDPFAGSGTTLEACLNTDRNGIGIEKSPAYLEIARKRIAAELAKTALLTA